MISPMHSAQGLKRCKLFHMSTFQRNSDGIHVSGHLALNPKIRKYMSSASPASDKWL